VDRVLQLVSHVYSVLSNRQNSYDALFSGLVDFMDFQRMPDACTLNDPRVLEMHAALCEKRDQRRIARMESAIAFARTRLAVGKPESLWGTLEARADGIEALFLQKRDTHLLEQEELTLHLYDSHITFGGEHVWELWHDALEKAKAIRDIRLRAKGIVNLSKVFDAVHGKSDAARHNRSTFRALTETHKNYVESGSNDAAYNALFRGVGTTNSRDPFSDDKNSLVSVFHATSAVQKFGWYSLADTRAFPVPMGDETTKLLREIIQIADMVMPSGPLKATKRFENVMNGVLKRVNAHLKKTSGRNVAVNTYCIDFEGFPVPVGYKLFDAEACTGKDGYSAFYKRVLHMCTDECKRYPTSCSAKQSYADHLPKYRAGLQKYIRNMQRAIEAGSTSADVQSALITKVQADLARATRLQRHVEIVPEIIFSKRVGDMFEEFEGQYRR
jgi:hypothetical protein